MPVGKHMAAAMMLGGVGMFLACIGIPDPEGEARDTFFVQAVEPDAEVGTEVPARFAASTRTPWPLATMGDSVLAALDDADKTAWDAANEEIATVYSAGGSLARIDVETSVAAVEVRGFKPSRLGSPTVGEWQTLSVANGRARAVFTQPWPAAELRVPGGGTVTAIRLFTTSERAPVILDPWVIAGETNAEGALLVDVKQARIGEVQAEGCMVRKPMPPPDADFRGSCQKTESGITLRGELPYVGAIDETVAVWSVSKCMVVVDGWPLVRCR